MEKIKIINYYFVEYKTICISVSIIEQSKQKPMQFGFNLKTFKVLQKINERLFLKSILLILNAVSKTVRKILSRDLIRS